MSHPDEGLIHTWLDGELDAAEAARVEALVRDDPAWGAAAAEARGLVAASARIIGALDHVPANVVPMSGGAARKVAADPSSGRAKAAPRALPWWAMRAAAVLVVATGTVVVFTRTSPEPATIAAVPAALPAAAAPESARELKDASVGAALNETKARERGALNDARGDAQGLAGVQGKLDAANQAVRDRGERAKASSADERRVAGTDRATADKAADALTDLKKEAASKLADNLPVPTVVGQAAAAPPAAPPSPQGAASASGAAGASAKTLSAVVTTASPAPSSRAGGGAGLGSALAVTEAAPLRAGVVNAISREECYREAPASVGGAPVIHHVGRTGDTTAIAGATLGFRREADAARARQVQSLAPNQAPATLRVRGDTLFLGIASGPVRIALRITCPAP